MMLNILGCRVALILADLHYPTYLSRDVRV
jgi:hypothetical protein